MFYMGGITLGYLQPPRSAAEKPEDVEPKVTGSVAAPVVEIAKETRKSADSTPFLWVRQWMM